MQSLLQAKQRPTSIIKTFLVFKVQSLHYRFPFWEQFTNTCIAKMGVGGWGGN